MAFKVACILLTLAVVCYGLPQYGPGGFIPDPGFSDGQGHGGVEHDGGFQGGFVPDPGFSDGQGHGGVEHQHGGFVPDPGFSDGQGNGGVDLVGHGIEY